MVGIRKEYIDETARTLGVRFKEYTYGKHPNSACYRTHLHHTPQDILADVKVVVKENVTLRGK